MTKRYIHITLSILLIIISYGYIFHKIISFDKIENLKLSIEIFSFLQIIMVGFVIMLMLLNWGIEALKWKLLSKEIQEFSFKDSFKAVLAGISIGIITPNRIGEIGGRVAFFDKGKRTSGVIATSTGSYAQLLTTIIFGLIGYWIMISQYRHLAKSDLLFNYAWAISLFVLTSLFIWSFFNLHKIKNTLLRFNFFRKRHQQLDYLSQLNFNSLIITLILSCLRYFVFISQYYLLLFVFNIHLTPISAFVSISLIYLFSTLIPTTTLAELGIRGSLAIFFIGLFSNQLVHIVFSTILLWIINLAIPSIIGSLFFIKRSITPK